MFARTLPFAILLFGLFSCSPDNEPSQETGELFGAAFTTDEVQSAESLRASHLLDDPGDSLRLTVRGTVDEVCQAKGCWMTLAGEQGEEIKVTFKDYGFFVPKDISGQDVIMHGLLYVQETPVSELRHFAQDAGASPEEVAAIAAPRREVRFLAEGVRLLD